MVLITIPTTPEKGVLQAYTLNVTDLIALISDPYFQQQSNWSKVVALYQSSVSNQIEAITFIPDGVSTTLSVDAEFSLNARNVFDLNSIMIIDDQNGRNITYAASIPDVANYTIDLTPAPSSLWDVFLLPTIATAGNGELHREGGSNGDVDNTAYYGTLVSGDFVFSGEVPTYSTGTSLFIGYRRTVPQAGFGYNSLFNTALNISNNSGFVQVEKLAGIGDTATNVGMVALYSPATFSFSISRVSGVITATFNNVVRFTDNNADPIYLMTSLPNLSGLMNSATLVETPAPSLLYVKDFSDPDYAADLSFNPGTTWVLNGSTARAEGPGGFGGLEMTLTNAAMLAGIMDGDSYIIRIYVASAAGAGYLGGNLKGGNIDQNLFQFTNPLPPYYEQTVVAGAGASFRLDASNLPNPNFFEISKIEVYTIF
jgi:hypothetical protein